MFASKASTKALRSGVRRTAQMTRAQPTRGMAGGKYLYVSEIHKNAGEAFGVVAWLWVFHRARQDLPVMYGFRHPWEHGDHDDHGHGHGHGGGHSEFEEQMEKFNSKAIIQAEVEDDDEDDDE